MKVHGLGLVTLNPSLNNILDLDFLTIILDIFTLGFVIKRNVQTLFRTNMIWQFSFDLYSYTVECPRRTTVLLWKGEGHVWRLHMCG